MPKVKESFNNIRQLRGYVGVTVFEAFYSYSTKFCRPITFD